MFRGAPAVRGTRRAARARLAALVRIPALAAIAVLAAGVALGLPGQAAPPPEVTTDAVDLTAPTETAGPGWTGEVAADPELVGVEWQGDPGAAFAIETRDASGAWMPAGTVEAVPRDEGPDDGSLDAARQPTTFVSEPLWVGEDVTGVRVRVDAGAAADLDLHAVNSPAAGVPDGSAVADGAVLLVGEGGVRAVRIAALAALALVALALVRRRVRSTEGGSRRRAVGVLAVAVVGLAACVPAPPPPPTTGVARPAPLISRARWGANESLRTANCPGGPSYMPAVKLAVVHHTVNSNSYTAAQGPQLVRGIYGYHTQSLGYCDIAYNFLVDRYGNVYEGRYGGTDKAVMGAHARGFNTASTGVALIGDFRTAVPPDAALTALESVLAWKLSVHKVNPRTKFTYTTAGNEKYAPNSKVPVDPITYHAFTGSSECPGKQVIDRMGQIRSRVATRMGV
jgi:hypothetical protein